MACDGLLLGVGHADVTRAGDLARAGRRGSAAPAHGRAPAGSGASSSPCRTVTARPSSSCRRARVSCPATAAHLGEDRRAGRALAGAHPEVLADALGMLAARALARRAPVAIRSKRLRRAPTPRSAARPAAATDGTPGAAVGASCSPAAASARARGGRAPGAGRSCRPSRRRGRARSTPAASRTASASPTMSSSVSAADAVGLAGAAVVEGDHAGAVATCGSSRYQACELPPGP